MKSLGLTRHASTVVAWALLAGCGGLQPPFGTSAVRAQSPAAAVRATGGDLVFASDPDTGDDVYIYSFPDGNPVGELGGFASNYYAVGLCSDGSGNVFVTTFWYLSQISGPGLIYEYTHGGDLVATLKDPGAARGCAVDPTTGNLAVTNTSGHKGKAGNVAIYRNARGRPAIYSDPNIETFVFCTYDTSGDLFVSADTKYSLAHLFELPKGSSTFTEITLTKPFEVGSIQWVDGALVAAVDGIGGGRGKQLIYRIHISGSTGTVSAPTELRNRYNRKVDGNVQFWVYDHTIVGPERSGGISFWRYPKGGRPKTNAGAESVYGVTVSVAGN